MLDARITTDGLQKCRLCNSHRLKNELVAKGYFLNKCRNCGFGQIQNIPTGQELVSEYNAVNQKQISYRSTKAIENENSYRLKLVTKFLEPKSKILDIGCGFGDFVAACEVFDCFGVDFSNSAVTYAKNKYPKIASKFFALDLERENVEIERFDAITAWDVIEHLTDPKPVLSNILSQLSVNGYLFISTPDFGSFTAKTMRSFWHFFTPPQHLSYFSRKSFINFLKSQSKGDDFEILAMFNRGKKTNLSFMLYKLGQMTRGVVSHKSFGWLVNLKIRHFCVGNISFYIPTNDLMYVVIRRKK